MSGNDALVPGTDLEGMLMARYVCPKAMKHAFIAQGLINHNIYDIRNYTPIFIVAHCSQSNIITKPCH